MHAMLNNPRAITLHEVVTVCTISNWSQPFVIFVSNGSGSQILMKQILRQIQPVKAKFEFMSNYLLLSGKQNVGSSLCLSFSVFY